MKAKEIMTANPCCCTSDDSVQDVARLMLDNDCGSVPVVDADSGLVVGTVTDRDLALRVLAAGEGPDTRIADVMTANPCCCSVDDSLRDVELTMATNQVRRVPIVDSEGRLAGIIAQADLARAAHDNRRVTEHEVAIVVEQISEPSPGSARRGGEWNELEQRL